MAEPLLGFKAGRALRREGTNIVDCDPAKGAILLSNGEDGLLHFMWKNRTTNEVEEDLILFPSDAIFSKVTQSSSGRVYVLKFSSSNQRHFFWMQDASSDRDEEFVINVNGLLENPEYTMSWNTSAGGNPQPEASTSTQTSSYVTSNFQATPEQIAQLSALLAQGAQNAQATEQPPDLSLTDILTPANLTPLFTHHPELLPSLFPYLPPDLPVPPSVEVLNRIINSPQFRAAVSNFDQALRTGLLGGLVRGLGLPDEAGTGILPFLRSVQEQADRERGGNEDNDMETD
ncbi:adhesion regulating molecule [Tricholoma matsutake]|nr:adhesion regulating molecule [Tricholoma matsutake 945]